MALSGGTRLGPYEILAAIGAGGMGEVYRARDTKLDRDVAIKILPELFASDAERVARFEREAKTLAALNHPHIAQIYGLEDAGGVRALVMELVEGPTLADRIAHGPVPLIEALAIAKQIAEALEAAHELGIIHRDLKPANVKVRDDGTVKVLDFGLAKAVDQGSGIGDQGSGNATNAPTITSPAAMTHQGVILGTAAYMAPEQAKGRPVDKRADIWAFGVVLFEMLTGTRAFPGDDVSDTLASVLKTDPEWTTLPSETPTPVRRLLRRCLEKDSRRRLQAIGDARLELDEATAAPVDDAPATAPLPRGRSTRAVIVERAAWTVVGALVAAGVGLLIARATTSRSMETPVVRFDIQPPPGERFPGSSGAPRFSVSPDGQHVVFSSSLPGKRDQLWLRSLDGPEARPIVGTESPAQGGLAAQQPFWSPDSRRIAFFDETAEKLKTVDLQGGPVQTLCDVRRNQYGGSWNAGGDILFATLPTNGIRRVSASGGTPVQVTTIDRSHQETSHLWPVFLPDGCHFLYHVRTSGGDAAAVYVGSLDSHERRKLVESDYMALFGPPNRLLYVRGASLMAQTVDLGTYALVGEPAMVADAVFRASNGRIAVSASNSGVLVYARDPAGSSASANYQLVWRDRSGNPLGPGGARLGSPWVRLSPDGKRVAIPDANPAAPNDIWIEDVERGVRTRLTTDQAPDTEPVWSPDGTRVIFRSSRGNPRGEGLYEKAGTGAVAETLVSQFEPGVQVHPSDWSTDGRFVVFRTSKAAPPTPADLWMLPLSGDRKPVLYLANSFYNTNPALSPNGRWLAYATLESGAIQVVVQPFPDPSRGKWQISSRGGRYPRWRRDGRELFYMDPQSRIVAVSVTTDDIFTVGKATPLFETEFALVPVGSPFDVTADGQRFVVAAATRAAASALTVTLNWTASLGK